MVELTDKITVHNMDCMDYMKGLEDNAFDLAIVDPPYGIGMSGGNVGYKGFNNLERKEWDNDIPDEKYFNELFRVSKNQIVWGGNYFKLRPSRAFIVWDKGEGFYNRTYAECELAWCSFDRNAKIYKRDPLCNGDYKGKIHPTQKPVKLYEWILKNYGPECEYCHGLGSYDEDVAGDGGSCMRMDCEECMGTGNGRILDTHLGSGSSAIACHNYGYEFVGIELDEDYFKDMVKRFKQVTAQTTLF